MRTNFSLTFPSCTVLNKCSVIVTKEYRLLLLLLRTPHCDVLGEGDKVLRSLTPCGSCQVRDAGAAK